MLLSIGANQYARWITGLPLTDSTGGFKCFHRQVLEAIDSTRCGRTATAFQIEMSFRAWKKGFRLMEIPIVFTDRIEGQSKMNKRIVREAIWMVWWLRLQSLIGAPVKGTVFYKMTGSGNDFVMLDGRSRARAVAGEPEIRRSATGGTGSGPTGWSSSRPRARRASGWSTGTPTDLAGAMCGNAALCSGRLAVDLELVATGSSSAC